MTEQDRLIRDLKRLNDRLIKALIHMSSQGWGEPMTKEEAYDYVNSLDDT